MACVAVLGLWGCSDPTLASLSFNIGTQDTPLRVVLDAEALELPPELRDDGTDPPSVQSIPCEPDQAVCPSTDDVTTSCIEGVCTPDPVVVSMPLGDVLDLETLRAQNDLVDVQAFEITGVTYAVASNTLTTDLPDFTVLWASEGATSGETPVATGPAVTAGERPSGEMALDEPGRDALSEFLLTSSPPRARFFVESVLDLQPGDPWPEGRLEVEAIVHVRMEGGLL